MSTLKEMSYVLGFAMSDGTVQRKNCRLYSTDIQILRDITEILYPDKPEKVKLVKRSIGKPYYCLVLSVHHTSELFRLGLSTSKESHQLSSDVVIEEFLRGFLDGDGTIALRADKDGVKRLINQVSLLVRKDLGEILTQKIKNLGFSPTFRLERSVLRTNQKYEVYLIGLGGVQAVRFLEMLYKSPGLKLERKKNIFDQIDRKHYSKANETSSES